MRAALGASTATLRRTLLAESLLLCGTGAVLGVAIAQPMVAVLGRVRRALLGARARSDARRQPAVGRRRPGDGRRGAARVRAAAAVRRRVARVRALERRPAHHRRDQPAAASLRRHADRGVVRAARRRRHAAANAADAAGDGPRLRDRRASSRSTCRSRRTAGRRSRCAGSTARCSAASAPCPASSASRSAAPCRGATPEASATAFSSRSKGARARTAEDDPRARFRSVSPGFFAALGIPLVGGPRLHRGRSQRRRARRHHQPEHRASSSFPGRIRSTAT